MPRNQKRRRKVRQFRTREAIFRVPKVRDRLALLAAKLGIKKNPRKVRVTMVRLGRKANNGKKA